MAKKIKIYSKRSIRRHTIAFDLGGRLDFESRMPCTIKPEQQQGAGRQLAANR
jgi:hypothetical protein